MVTEDINEQPKKQSEIKLKDILIQSVKETKSMGTSTFVAAMLHESEMKLYGLNLGDSGYMLIRGREGAEFLGTPSGKVEDAYDLLYRTKEQ